MPGESPEPERLSGKQMHDAPGSGQGTDDATKKEETNKKILEVYHCAAWVIRSALTA